MFIIEATGRKAFSQIFETKQIFAKCLSVGNTLAYFDGTWMAKKKVFLIFVTDLVG